MSLSHASPEELLLNSPEPDVLAEEISSVTEPNTRKKGLLSLKKLARSTGIGFLTICFIGAVVIISVMVRELSNLTIRVNTLDAAFRSGQIGQLTSNVAAMEVRLKTLEKQASELAKLPSDVQSISSQQASLRDSFKQTSDAIFAGGQEVTQLLSRVSLLEGEVRQSAAALSEVNSLMAQKEKATAASERLKSPMPPKAVNAVKKTKRSVRRAAAPAAPFVLTGIERRGGQTFAVVMPRGAFQITSMRLLSTGDGMLGWTLEAIEGNRAALFVVNGTERRLSVE